MFKSLQWKVVSMFLLLVFAILTIAGTFLILSVTNFYNSAFAEEMDSVFEPSFISQLEAGNEEYLRTTLEVRSARMGIDTYRNYFVLSASDGSVAASSIEASKPQAMNTSNMIAALSGRVGREVSSRAAYMDYAVPVSVGGRGYVIYIIDSKDELTKIIQQIVAIILQALLLGLVISFVLGYFLSKTITTPIANLTRKAKRLSEGEFEYRIDVKSDDEIGTLTKTFNDMSSKLQETLSEISREKNKVEALLLNMTDGVMAFDTAGNVIHINPTARKLFHLCEGEDLHFDEFFSSVGANIQMGDLLYFNESRKCERDIDFEAVRLKANFVAFEDEKENTGGVLIVLHDITKQQKLDDSRREFVANVSHELRTPLTTLKTYTETLHDMLGENQTAAQFLNTIMNETDRMARLVKDLLVLSSLDHSSALNKAAFPLKDLITDVVGTMKMVAREQGHRLSFSTTTELPAFYGDRDRLEQVLYNIISNSVKYTPNGGKIDVFSGKIYNDVYIRIRDNGIGIPEKDLSQIFERFYRVDKARSRELGGTGLGLAISKGIVEAHGGSIKITSKVDKGTEVLITLPLLSPDGQM